jgi:hypothetical protein
VFDGVIFFSLLRFNDFFLASIERFFFVMALNNIHVIVPNTGLWRQIEGPNSSYCAFVWHT